MPIHTIRKKAIIATTPTLSICPAVIMVSGSAPWRISMVASSWRTSIWATSTAYSLLTGSGKGLRQYCSPPARLSRSPARMGGNALLGVVFKHASSLFRVPRGSAACWARYLFQRSEAEGPIAGDEWWRSVEAREGRLPSLGISRGRSHAPSAAIFVSLLIG